MRCDGRRRPEPVGQAAGNRGRRCSQWCCPAYASESKMVDRMARTHAHLRATASYPHSRVSRWKSPLAALFPPTPHFAHKCSHQNGYTEYVESLHSTDLTSAVPYLLLRRDGTDICIYTLNGLLLLHGCRGGEWPLFECVLL